ncbi:MAG TPA: CopG family transcriptional regulator [Stellaceae bacterium]|nr:CopG family transcriptional regulator [Stellaceae bacterium]
MRTTLTLDNDVAAAIERLRRARGSNFKDLVNEALRCGLRELSVAAKPRQPFQTQSVDLGRVLIGSIDSVTDVLAAAEGEGFR